MTQSAENDAPRPMCEMWGCALTAVGLGDIDGDEFWLCDEHRYPAPRDIASRWCATHDEPAAEHWSAECLIPPARSER